MEINFQTTKLRMDLYHESFFGVPENAEADVKKRVYRDVFQTLSNVYDKIFLATIFNG